MVNLAQKNSLVQEADLSYEQLRGLLVDGGHVSADDFAEDEVLAVQQNKSIGAVLAEKGRITNSRLGLLIADFLKMEFVDLMSVGIDQLVMEKITENIARSQFVLPFAEDLVGVKVAMNNPKSLESRHLLSQVIGKKVFPFYATRVDLLDSFFRYKLGLSEDFKIIFDKLKDKSLPDEERDAQTIVLVDKLLQYAYFNKASDIHIEPAEIAVLVRFRVDGILHDITSFPKEVYTLMLTRLKILAKMRTDEHLVAQDGKLRFIITGGQERKVDVRVSVVPVIYGENVVMRILSEQIRELSLSDLGFSEKNLTLVKKAIKHPFGMILVTGPTGSGKTTTLYSVLRLLNSREVNIATIEDPVEYNIAGVSQIQVNVKSGLTFAKGLRAIVRQDPNIIMVGEIRDSETADIAVNAAMTGHLVLSTLHTNDAATTLPRLLDMGVEPFLVSSTVNLVIAQRLVRKVCNKCRYSYTLEENSNELKAFTELMKEYEGEKSKDLKNLRLYRGKGCEVCSNSGYSGRIGIYELLEMSEEVSKLVIARVSSGDLRDLAVKEGMITMFEDGMEKVRTGVTTIDEVLRVTAE